MRRLLPAILLTGAAAFAQEPGLFDYDRSKPLDVREVSRRDHGGATVIDLTFASAGEGRTAAYVVRPKGAGRFAGVLYVHWYEPESSTSNRMQFLDEAVQMARRGAVSVLVETMWSDPRWFEKRNRAGDFAHSVRQVKELRRALDLLEAQPGIDRKRIGYAGHDFGAMYGAILAGVERERVAAWALQAGTTSLSDWFLLGPPKLEGAERQKFIDEMAPLDPVRFIGRAAPSPVLFQFAHEDRYVPKAKAIAFFDAAGDPKELRWYDGGHGLEPHAVTSRIEWMAERLGLAK